mgnify:CR=1 FL=1
MWTVERALSSFRAQLSVEEVDHRLHLEGARGVEASQAPLLPDAPERPEDLRMAIALHRVEGLHTRQLLHKDGDRSTAWRWQTIRRW